MFARPLSHLAVLAAILLPAAVLPAADAPDQAALEKAFAQKLTNVKLVGRFTMGADGEPKKDSYTILRAAKAEGDDWLITAKIEYKGLALPIEMRLPVKWAGDTPVISITDKKIPGFGTFTARVMFYGDEYAGTWSGGTHGGLMWGRLEKITDTKGDAEKPAPAPSETPSK